MSEFEEFIRDGEGDSSFALWLSWRCYCCYCCFASMEFDAPVSTDDISSDMDISMIEFGYCLSVYNSSSMLSPFICSG